MKLFKLQHWCFKKEYQLPQENERIPAINEVLYGRLNCKKVIFCKRATKLERFSKAVMKKKLFVATAKSNNTQQLPRFLIN